MDSVIHLSLPTACGLVVAFLATVFAFGRILLSQFERRMTDRFVAQDALRAAEAKLHDSKVEAVGRALAEEANRVGNLAQSLQNLHTKLPYEYVLREDWIRFSATIDKKLDRLAELMQKTGDRA